MMNTLDLKTGANVLTVVGRRTGETVTARHQALAVDLARGLGELEFAGVKLRRSFWVAGVARPISIADKEPTAKLLSWYEKRGSRMGDAPMFYSLTVDWRGSAKSYSWADERYWAPRQSVQHGEPMWPDGDASELRNWLDDVATAQWLSDLGGSLSGGLKAVGGAAKAAAGSAGKSLADALGWLPWAAGGILLVGGLLAVTLARKGR